MCGRLTEDNRKAEYLRELGILMYSMFTTRKSRLTPVDFLDTFREMEYKVQRDVYEFFNEFLNNLEDSLKLHDKPLDALNENTKGEFINEIRFVSCGHIVPMHKEEFIVLSLEVREMGDISRSLEYFSHWELLQSSPQKCSVCNVVSQREKRTRIGKLPKELIIHLKRFQFEKGRFVKLNEGFRFTEELSIKEGVKTEQLGKQAGVPKKFKLRGVVCHMGSVEFGHYISLVKKGCKRHLDRDGRGEGLARELQQNYMQDIEEFNFRKKIKSHPHAPAKSNWILYNDDQVLEYEEKNLPRDCFGQFEDENEYSMDKFRGVSQGARQAKPEESELSQDKKDLLRDLGVFDPENVKEKSKEKDKDPELQKAVDQSKKSSGMNAYLLFYRSEGREDAGMIDKIVHQTRVSPFGRDIQADLDRELILENRARIFPSYSGWRFVQSVLVRGFKECLTQANQANMQYFADAFALGSSYFFNFLCSFFSKSKTSDVLPDMANFLLGFLCPAQFEDSCKKWVSRVDAQFDEQTKHTVILRFSLHVLSQFSESVRLSNASDTERNLSLLLLSSNKDIYGSNGAFVRNASTPDKALKSLGMFSWVAEVLVQCVTNVVSFLDNCCWDQKKILFDFLKICLKMLALYQVNASAYLVVLAEALESQEVCWVLYRCGFQGVFFGLVPQLFSEIPEKALRRWLYFGEYFSTDLAKEGVYKDCKTIQDYYTVLHTEGASDPKSTFISMITNRKLFQLQRNISAQIGEFGELPQPLRK